MGKSYLIYDISQKSTNSNFVEVSMPAEMLRIQRSKRIIKPVLLP